MCCIGAEEIRKDQLAMHIQGAYYTAYWNNAKRPIALSAVLHKLQKNEAAPRPDVNVNEFLEKKRRFIDNGGFKGYTNS